MPLHFAMIHAFYATFEVGKARGPTADLCITK